MNDLPKGLVPRPRPLRRDPGFWVATVALGLIALGALCLVGAPS